MGALDFLSAYSAREGEQDALKATWYIVAVRTGRLLRLVSLY